MPVPSASSRVALATVAALSLTGSAAQAASLRFENVFDTRRAPAASHAVVLFRAGGGMHRMEIWRNGEAQLRRDTDRRMTVLVSHPARQADFRLDMLDHQRRIHTRIDRDSLVRVGHFTDWQDMAHGVRHPGGAYMLREVANVRPPQAPLLPCRWYELAQGKQVSRICWSGAEALPILILDAANQPVWRATAIDHKPVPAAIFRPDSRGYVFNDAQRDISGD